MYKIAKWSFGLAAVMALAMNFSTPALTQDVLQRTPEFQAQPAAVYTPPPTTAVKQEGTVIIPPSAVQRPEDAGRFAHTNIKLFVPAGKTLGTISPENTFAEYPESIACVYHNGPQYAGCVPANNGQNTFTGGWGAIALVDAYDDPHALADLKFFSTYFGLKPVYSDTYKTVIANSSFGTLGGITPSCNGTPPNASASGWDVEESLDIEWAHVMAPSAKIILVEACSNSLNDLLYAEAVAGIEVTADGGGDISNSWSTGEYAGEVGTTDDFFYRYYYQNITYFASAGDSGWGAGYPSSSPWVVSAGGTTINRDSSGNFLSESCWSGSGGGVSAFETWQTTPNILDGMGPWSDFQYEMTGPAARQTPDMSFDADPNSGVYVYDTDSGGTWLIVGGTSVSSPSLAGLVNVSDNRFGQTPPSGGYYSTQENNYTYGQLYSREAYLINFYDVTTGSNGSGHNAGVGYDQCTGIGSPRGRYGK